MNVSRPVLRRCVACRQLLDRSMLWRVIRDHQNGVCLDQGMGRSAYLCANEACLEEARRRVQETGHTHLLDGWEVLRSEPSLLVAELRRLLVAAQVGHLVLEQLEREGVLLQGLVVLAAGELLVALLAKHVCSAQAPRAERSSE